MDWSMAVSLLALICSAAAVGAVLWTQRRDAPEDSAEASGNIYSSKEAERAAKKRPAITPEELRKTMASIDNYRKQ